MPTVPFCCKNPETTTSSPALSLLCAKSQVRHGPRSRAPGGIIDFGLDLPLRWLFLLHGNWSSSQLRFGEWPDWLSAVLVCIPCPLHASQRKWSSEEWGGEIEGRDRGKKTEKWVGGGGLKSEKEDGEKARKNYGSLLKALVLKLSAEILL